MSRSGTLGGEEIGLDDDAVASTGRVPLLAGVVRAGGVLPLDNGIDASPLLPT